MPITAAWLFSGECSIAPVAVAVMNGGYRTLEAACNAAKSGIPVLVFKGTGKAANLIAFFYIFYKNHDNLLVFLLSCVSLLNQHIMITIIIVITYHLNLLWGPNP